MERLNDRNHGRYVATQLKESTELIDAAQEGSSAARHLRSTLEISVQPAATTEMSAQPLAPESRIDNASQPRALVDRTCSKTVATCRDQQTSS